MFWKGLVDITRLSNKIMEKTCSSFDRREGTEDVPKGEEPLPGDAMTVQSPDRRTK